jgi:hypothetical protein
MKLRALLFMLLLAPATGFSHSLSDSYLNLSLDNSDAEIPLMTGHWLIAVRDLELAVGVDANHDGRVTWGELQQRRTEIAAYALSRLQVRSAGRTCQLNPGSFQVEALNAGIFLHIPLSGACPGYQSLEFTYSLLFDIDSSHRGILSLQTTTGPAIRIFSPDTSVQLIIQGESSALKNFGIFIVEGIWHIWIGLDHILFLTALLIPIVLGIRHKVQELSPRSSAARILSLEILKVVTAFTIAHSVTLVLATLEVIVLPSRWVESVIALSVVVSGLNIIFPFLRRYHWQMAFVFGLIHGFGFAGVLSDLSLPAGLFVGSLLGFNLGVEIGQLSIVLVLVPLLLVLGSRAFSRNATMVVSGVVISVFGLAWLAERSVGITVPAGL